MAGGGQDGGPGLPTSGLITVAVLLASAVVVHQLPYIVSRPAVSDSAWRPMVARQDVDARLWQDPFGAVTQHIEQMQPRPLGSKPDLTEPIRHDVVDLAGDVRPILQKTLVLPVMVPGGRHGEDVEGRRRTRYAVVAAMSKLGFTPVDAEHIGFFWSRPSNVRGLDLPKIVPWERFEKTGHPVLKSDATKVLVLWLDASAFGDTPLTKIRQILSDLDLCQGQSPAKARVVMIGPASSDDLLALLNEKIPPTPGCLKGMAIYSPWATASWPPDQASVTYLLPAGIRFVRMVGTDKSLMPALRGELARRGVKAPLQTHTIAVVHELDTSYGRDIVKEVRAALCPLGTGPNCVYALGYLRGIDGKIPKRSELKEAPSDSKSPDAKPGPASSESLERAEGDSQFDHLRRLAARMRSEHDRLVRDGKPGITTVGVLGSDLYDKLLVLQAVRQEFPTAAFFTTDLDARYMHPREFQWTRNLIVASSFGLDLREEIQAHLPPFRNNYQTATFLAVTVGVVNAVPEGQPLLVEDGTITQWLKDPGVYEIGRTEALDVSARWVGRRKAPDEGCEILAHCPTVHPEPVFLDTPYKRTLWAWMLSAAFAGILILLVSTDARTNLAASLRWAGQHPKTSVVTLLAVIALSWMFVIRVRGEGRLGEPFRFFEGVSIWPTEILRAVAFLVATIGIVMTEVRRKRTDKALQSRYFKQFVPPTDYGPRVVKLAREAWAAVRLAGKALVHPSVLRKLPARGVAPTWGRVFAGKPGRSYFQRPREVVDTEGLWAEHTYQNAAVARWTRILVFSILFFLLGGALMVALGPPVTPARGNVAWWVDRIVVFSTVGALIVLIFCVADMIRLCDKFAYCLGAPIDNRWPPATRKYFGVKPVDKETPHDAWIDVRFLAEWTGRIGGLIYYPFVVLFLVIVARSSIFDNWDMPPSLVTVVLLSIATASATVLILRRAAERLRRVSIDRLVTALVLEEGVAADEAKMKQLRTILEEVRQLGEGAFAPITSQPIVRAALLPLSGAGGIALLEYFFLRR